MIFNTEIMFSPTCSQVSVFVGLDALLLSSSGFLSPLSLRSGLFLEAMTILLLAKAKWIASSGPSSSRSRSCLLLLMLLFVSGNSRKHRYKCTFLVVIFFFDFSLGVCTAVCVYTRIDNIIYISLTSKKGKELS